MQHAPDGSVVGQQGIKYGLQLSAVALKKQSAAGVGRRTPASAAPCRPAGAASVFGDDDSDEDVEAQVAKQAEKKRSAAKVQQMYEEALAEDPSVFDYDGVYDSMQAARSQPKQQDKIQRQSKYIMQLKDQAEQRKREEDIRYERRLLKERVAEDALFEDKEKFVTAAYRRKLEEDKKWAAEQKKRDEEEERNDVRKVGHLGNFYANLLTKNVAMGTAKVEGQERKHPKESTAGASSEAALPAIHTDGAAEPASQPAIAMKPPSLKQPALDRYEQLRLDAARALLEEHAAVPAGQDTPQPPREARNEDGGGEDAASGGVEPAPAAATTGDGGIASGGLPVRTPANTPVLPAKRRNDDQAVLSARERYMARKKTQQAG